MYTYANIYIQPYTENYVLLEMTKSSSNPVTEEAQRKDKKEDYI